MWFYCTFNRLLVSSFEKLWIRTWSIFTQSLSRTYLRMIQRLPYSVSSSSLAPHSVQSTKHFMYHVPVVSCELNTSSFSIRRFFHHLECISTRMGLGNSNSILMRRCTETAITQGFIPRFNDLHKLLVEIFSFRIFF